MKTKILHIGEFKIRINWLVAIFVFAAIFGLVRLGLWQLDRAGEKLARQEHFDELRAGVATPIHEVSFAGIRADTERLQSKKVSLSGQYLNDKNIFLIYQTHEDLPGYEVITPFELDDDSGVVMVSRGWSTAPSFQLLTAKIARVEGPKQVIGQLFIPSESLAKMKNNIELINWPLLIRYLNPLELQPYFDKPLFPYVVRLDEKQDGVLVRHWSTVMVNTSSNFSYALQWFSMAICVAVTALILSSNLRDLVKERFGPQNQEEAHR